MADIFCERNSKSWFGRIGHSIKGIVFGLGFLAISVGLLCWNEGRAVTTANSLKEAAAAVVSVPRAEVLPANDQKLIHLSGEVTTEETLRDPVFGIEAIALRLVRRVEMYQWQEEKTTETRKKMGGSEETTTRYEYTRGWSGKLIRSSEFQQPDGHLNPSTMPVPATSFVTSKATLGAFQIPENLISKMPGDQPLRPTAAALANVPDEWKDKVKLDGEIVYFGQDPAAPQVGDERVTFRMLGPAVFSVLSRQAGRTLEPYLTKAGREIQRVESGTVRADLMFVRAHRENTILTWAARIGGFILMFLGCSMILKLLGVVADFVPFLGNMVGAGTGLISAVLSFAGSLIVIALAWLAVRPLLGGALLLAAVGAVVWGVQRARQRATPPSIR